MIIIVIIIIIITTIITILPYTENIGSKIFKTLDTAQGSLIS